MELFPFFFFSFFFDTQQIRILLGGRASSKTKEEHENRSEIQLINQGRKEANKT